MKIEFRQVFRKISISTFARWSIWYTIHNLLSGTFPLTQFKFLSGGGSLHTAKQKRGRSINDLAVNARVQSSPRASAVPSQTIELTIIFLHIKNFNEAITYIHHPRFYKFTRNLFNFALVPKKFRQFSFVNISSIFGKWDMPHGFPVKAFRFWCFTTKPGFYVHQIGPFQLNLQSDIRKCIKRLLTTTIIIMNAKSKQRTHDAL